MSDVYLWEILKKWTELKPGEEATPWRQPDWDDHYYITRGLEGTVLMVDTKLDTQYPWQPTAAVWFRGDWQIWQGNQKSLDGPKSNL